MVQRWTARVTASQHMRRHTELKGCYFFFSSYSCAWLLETHPLCTSLCIHGFLHHFAVSLALYPFTATILRMGSVGCLQDRGTFSSRFWVLASWIMTFGNIKCLWISRCCCNPILSLQQHSLKLLPQTCEPNKSQWDVLRALATLTVS